MELKFIVDHNVGKLVKLLRLMGYDAVFFTGEDDGQMVRTALLEDRIILTRDTQVFQRRVITHGRLKAVLIQSDNVEDQVRQVINTLHLDCRFRPFTRCLECNQPLVEQTKEEVKGQFPAFVFKTQSQYRQCPKCGRIYWQGTHWEKMSQKLEKISRECGLGAGETAKGS